MKTLLRCIEYLGLVGVLCLSPLATSSAFLEDARVVKCSGRDVDSVVIQQHIDIGGEVYLSGDLCVLAKTVVIGKAGVLSASSSTRVTAHAAIGAYFELRTSDYRIDKMTLVSGPRSDNIGLLISKRYDNRPVQVHDLKAYSFARAVVVEDGDLIDIDGGAYQNNALAVDFINGGVNSSVRNIMAFGGAGVRLDMEKQGPEGLTLQNNKLLPGMGAACIQVYAGLFVRLTGNMCDQVLGGDGIIVRSDHPIAELKSTENWIGVGNSGNPSVGMRITENRFPILNMHSRGDVFYGWHQSGIRLEHVGGRKSNVEIEDPHFYYPGPPAKQEPVDIDLVDSTACSIRLPIYSGVAGLQRDAASRCNES